MATLREIRTRIGSVTSTQQVTRAMKMVAAAKLRRAQENIFKTRPYAFKISEIIGHFKHQGRFDPSSHPLFLERADMEGVLLIVIAGDRGLAGAFNANVIKTVEQAIVSNYASHKEAGRLHLIGVGNKAHEHFAKRGYQMVGDFRGVFHNLNFTTAQAIGDLATSGYLEGRWDEVKVAYNEFRNTITQDRVVEPFLPIPHERFLTPAMESEGARAPTFRESYTADYIFEPDARAILDILVPRYLNYQLWRALLESNAAEQGARMVAMDNATLNAGEMLRTLRLQYNRARQSAITTEILEIISGANALEEVS